MQIIAYAVLFLLTAVFVFKANDDTLPFSDILTLNYLIPVIIYASGAVGLSILIYQLGNKLVHKWIAFPVSLLIAIPTGIMLVQKLFLLISYM